MSDENIKRQWCENIRIFRWYLESQFSCRQGRQEMATDSPTKRKTRQFDVDIDAGAKREERSGSHGTAPL
jgi:hypothetical protein